MKSIGDIEFLEQRTLDNGWTLIRVGLMLNSEPWVEMWCHDNYQDAFVLKENMIYFRSESDAVLLKLSLKIPSPRVEAERKAGQKSPSTIAWGQAFRSVR